MTRAVESSLFLFRDLEWEVTHKKSRIHKGRGDTPEAALRDLREGFAKGIDAAQEELDREQKRLDKLSELLGETEPVFAVFDRGTRNLVAEFSSHEEATAYITSIDRDELVIVEGVAGE